jgi:hypothetical protein
MMKQFEENYAVRDKQDVLAMCFASQAEQNKLTTPMVKPSKELKNQCAFRSISRQLNVLYRN